MIIVLKQDAPDVQVREFCHELEDMGLQINDSKGSETHILGLIGDTKAIGRKLGAGKPGGGDLPPRVGALQKGQPQVPPGRQRHRRGRRQDRRRQLCGHRRALQHRERGADHLLRPAGKGRRCFPAARRCVQAPHLPYSFQGMRSEGLDLLKLARRATGSPIVTEIMNTEHLPLFENVDLIQVGARNMQNFELLKAVGRQKKPVLLKRGLANTLEEFVMSAEYIMAEGNENVILCERGIRTFETSMRNTLDLAGVVMLHKMTHLPVVVDPSHACGHAWMVPELAKAAVAAGADGLMIEVHNNPAKAKCDGAQSLTPDQFDELMQFIGKGSGVLRQK